MSRRGWVMFVAMGIIWGLPYLLIKIAVRDISPPLLVLMRTGGAALLLAPIAAARGELRPILRYWRPLCVYTVAEMAIPWILLFHAEERLTSSLAGLLIAAVPLAAAILAWVTGSDHLDRRRVVGLGVGFGGVALLVGFSVGSSDMWAAVSMAGVVIGYAIGPWVVAHHLSDAPPLGMVAGSLVLCAVAYAPIAAFALPAHGVSPEAIWSVVGLTLICTAVAFVVFFGLIAEVGPYRATIITYVNPAVAVLLGVTVLGEPFSLATAAGFVLIVAGCLLATGRTGRRPALEVVVGAELETSPLDGCLPDLRTDP
jgi:drug/metabolite transporter (DMT)-like permease